MKTKLIVKDFENNRYTYRTECDKRNDKRLFKYALIHGSSKRIIKLCNNAKQMEQEVNRWYYSHTIAIEIDTNKILWEKISL